MRLQYGLVITAQISEVVPHKADHINPGTGGSFMDKYIGLDINDNKTVACVVQKGKKDMYATFKTDILQMKNFLQTQRSNGEDLHLTFEIGGQAGYRYDHLIEHVRDITVSNPSKMTWIYRTAKKNDRIDARKQAVLLSIGEVPMVHIPTRQIRQWRITIQHRRKTVEKITAIKNRIRALLKSNGFVKAIHKGSWWKAANRLWMRSIADGTDRTDGWVISASRGPAWCGGFWWRRPGV